MARGFDSKAVESQQDDLRAARELTEMPVLVVAVFVVDVP